MISIGNFFFKYRNLLFPIVALSIFIPSPLVFRETFFGAHYYLIPFGIGLSLALFGQVLRGATIGLKYIVRGGKNKEVYAEDLVTEGIFNHCRNPLYVGNILMIAGAGILANSLIFVTIVLPLFIFIYQAIVLAEEKFLKNKFGNQYTLYSNRVNRWIPNFGGLSKTFASMKFDWSRYITSEYNTIYLLFVAIYMVLLTTFPPLSNLDMDSKFRLSTVVILLLSAIYSFVRYLKKSNRLAH